MPMKRPKGVTPRKFARALQEWRERKAFSQRDAAEFLGISKRTLENWEQERATPRGYNSSRSLAVPQLPPIVISDDF